MLETRFPRLPGDIGCPETFAFPVRYRVVAGAVPHRVVVEGDRSLLLPFVAAAKALADDGADAIATSCGFLVRFQREMAAAVPVPVWTSSLLLVAEVEAALGRGERAGVVSVDAASLGAADLASADTPVEGLAPGSGFRRALLENHATFDRCEAEAATVAAARRLVARHPEVAAIVLECTNLPPYADAVRRATGRPVHDITTMIASRFAALERTP